jgi:hypothetical protein
MTMKEQVEKRRCRLLFLLTLDNSVSAAIMAVSKEFGYDPEVIQRDYRNMDHWIDKVQHTQEKTHLLYTKLDFLSRQSTDVLLDCTKPKEKMEAIKSSLKITEAQIKLYEKRGYLKTKTHEVNQAPDLPLAFDSNPEIMAAYQKFASIQKADKETENKVCDQKEVAENANGKSEA